MALKDELQAAQDRLAAAVAARDASQIGPLYTADARLIPQGAPVCAGSGEIESFFSTAFENGIVSARFTTDEAEGDDAQACETGRYELYAAHPSGDRIRVAEGRYLVVWRKVDGHWRIHRDMFNTQ